MKRKRFFPIVTLVIITSVAFAKEDLPKYPAGGFLPSDFSKSDSSSVDLVSHPKEIRSVSLEMEEPVGGISRSQSKSQLLPSKPTEAISNYSVNQYWYREFTDEGINLPVLSIQQTEQGDLAVSGSGSGDGPWFGLLTSTGETNNTWQKKFGNAGSSPTFLPLQNGGFLALIYYGPSAVLVKLDSAGQVEWQNRYDGPSDEYPASMIETSDGNIVVVGKAKFWYDDLIKYWIFKVNSNTGDVIWNRVLGIGGSLSAATSVTELKNGDLVVAGNHGSANSIGLLVRLKPDGEIVWKKLFTDSDGGTSDIPELILEMSDGLLIVGRSGGNTWITKIDENGGVIWPQSISYINGEWNYSTAFVHAGDGNVLLLTRSVSQPYTSRLFKIDPSSGDIIWERNFNGYTAQSMDITTEGSILIAGNRYYGPGGVFKLDREGNLPSCAAIGVGNSTVASGATYTTIPFEGDVTQPEINVIESNIGIDDLLVNVTEICQSSTQTYSITGRVVDLSNKPILDVVVSAGLGFSTSTDANGYYTLQIPQGTYAVFPYKPDYDFSPSRIIVTVPPDNQTIKDFKGARWGGSPSPFLDLPFKPTSSFGLLLSFEDSSVGGRINSWFDHKYPNYGYNNSTGIWIHNGKYDDESKRWWADEDKTILCYDIFCYDGHDGIDFSYRDPDKGEDLSILAAAPGIVVDYFQGCPNSYSKTCGGGFGNWVLLYHTVDVGNGYFTRYGHLKNIEQSVIDKKNSGEQVSTNDVLGIMGTSGRSTGTHLHFGVYRDNGNGKWDGKDIDKLVDPFEYSIQEVDPWVEDHLGPPSYNLWKDLANQQTQFNGDQGAVITDKTGLISASIPANYFTGDTILELSPEPVAGASAQLRSTGISFWIRILQGLINTGVNQMSTRDSVSMPTTETISVTVNYTDTLVTHLDESALALYQWDDVQNEWSKLNSTVNESANVVTSTTSSFGGFNLQAPLLCASDSTEPNDGFFTSVNLPTGVTTQAQIFDLDVDEDWFSIDAHAGNKYVLETQNLAPGVDSVLEIYDMDGLTVLVQDNNGGDGLASKIEWQAPANGRYFVRVSPAEGSLVGCDAAYELSVMETARIFLPITIRN